MLLAVRQELDVMPPERVISWNLGRLPLQGESVLTVRRNWKNDLEVSESVGALPLLIGKYSWSNFSYSESNQRTTKDIPHRADPCIAKLVVK